ERVAMAGAKIVRQTKISLAPGNSKPEPCVWGDPAVKAAGDAPISNPAVMGSDGGVTLGIILPTKHGTPHVPKARFRCARRLIERSERPGRAVLGIAQRFDGVVRHGDYSRAVPYVGPRVAQ